MTAECPRKDGGELLLTKGFLSGCSTVYAVFPNSQENQGQPFLPKHFNVIDPLRTNNNLGRSVSKGNFYRIRSAFAFGAKKMVGLLSCSKENIVAEIDKFFMNTWSRHGTGKRPDAPPFSVSLLLQPSSAGLVSNEESQQKSANSKQMVESYGLLDNHRKAGDVFSSLNDITSSSYNSVDQTGQSLNRNINSNNLEIPISHVSPATSGMLNQIHRNITVNEFVQPELIRKNLRPLHLYPSGQGRFQFARTHSSPELSDPTHGIPALSAHNRVAETQNNQFSCGRPDESAQINIYGTSMVPDTNSNPKSCYDDAIFLNAEEKLASVPQSLEMHQEEQDLENVRIHSFNRQFQQTVKEPSHLPISSALPPAGYSQRNIGLYPANMPEVETHWGSNFQFHQVLVPSATNYLPSAQLDSNAAETVEYGNGRPGITCINQDDGDQAFWPDVDVSLSRGFASENRKSQVLTSDDRKVPSVGVNFIPSSREDSRIQNVRGQSRFIKETRRFLKTDHSDVSMFRNTRENGSFPHNRSENFRPTNNFKGGFSKKFVSESWDGPLSKGAKSSREKRGRKTPISTAVPSSYVRRNGWLSESSSLDGLPVSVNDYVGELNHEPKEDDPAEESIDSSPEMSVSHHVAATEQAFMSGSDPVIPVAPMLVYGGSRQRPGSGMDSVALYDFFPTGPPVPIFMVPVKIPPDPVTSDGPLEQYDEIDSSHLTSTIRNLDLTGRKEEPNLVLPSTSVEDASGKFDECKSDILYSDFSRHWQNLQYGRLCQDSNIPGPPVYPSPLVVPPLYLQGRFQWDGSGRPVPTIAPIMNYGPRLVPVMPFQPGSNRPVICHRFGDEVPRYRSGTGTYLPKTKVHFRERQSSMSRNNRGNYNYDRYNNSEREGSWVNSKSRISCNNQGRDQLDRPITRIDRSLPVDNQLDRSWETEEAERTSNRHNSTLSFSNSNNVSSRMAYNMYPLASVGSSNLDAGASVPSLMMLYQYDSSIGYASPEQVEFGSLGPVHLRGANEMQQASSVNVLRVSSEHRVDGYQQGSASSSPDQPSSPQFHRTT